MNTIKFPIFDLTINIRKIAFSIFGIDIYWYAIFIVFAIWLGVAICKKRDGLYMIKFADILDLLLYVIPIAILSARIYYVLFNFHYFQFFPSEILNIREGGLAIYGGIIGGAITCIVFCKKKNINILDLFDILTPCLALGQSIGRWGNFINVEAYGKITNLPWRMGIFESGKYIEVHPTFLYESIVTFILFIVLVNIKNKRKFRGQITYIYLIFYGIARMLIETLRTDSLMIGKAKVSCIVSFIIFIIGSFEYVKQMRKMKKI